MTATITKDVIKIDKVHSLYEILKDLKNRGGSFKIVNKETGYELKNCSILMMLSLCRRGGEVEITINANSQHFLSQIEYRLENL